MPIHHYLQRGSSSRRRNSNLPAQVSTGSRKFFPSVQKQHHLQYSNYLRSRTVHCRDVDSGGAILQSLDQYGVLRRSGPPFCKWSYCGWAGDDGPALCMMNQASAYYQYRGRGNILSIAQLNCVSKLGNFYFQLTNYPWQGPPTAIRFWVVQLPTQKSFQRKNIPPSPTIFYHHHPPL